MFTIEAQSVTAWR